MLDAILGFLKKLAFGTPTTEREVQAVPEEKKSLINHEWPFPSPQPPNEEYLVGELIKGVQVEGDHVFFYWNNQKRRHIRTSEGKETMLARNIVWWMDGRKVPAMANGLTTNCGEQKCIKLSHLILRMPQTVFGPENKQPEPRHVVTRSKRPLPPKVKPGNSTPLTKFTKENRTKCITRKAYFETEAAAKRHVRELNKPEVRGTGPRQYTYPCTQGCGGFHLTKIDPKKFGKKKVGSW